MDKYMYRLIVILLLSFISATQLVSCMCAEAVMTDTKAIKQEVKTIRDVVDGWEVEIRYQGEII